MDLYACGSPLHYPDEKPQSQKIERANNTLLVLKCLIGLQNDDLKIKQIF